jgi:hypothetical protein
VAGQKCNLPSFQVAEDVAIRRLAEWSLEAHFARVSQAGHRVEATAADDSNFRLPSASAVAVH